MAGSGCSTGVPPETACQGKNQPEPPSTQWVLDIARSTNATSETPRFTQVQASDKGVVVHYGDICNLGIYCDGSSTGNRSMYENNTVFPDAKGRLVVAWTDQRLDSQGQMDAAQSDAQTRQLAYDEVFATSQRGGPSLYPAPPTPPPSNRGCGQPSGRLTAHRLGPVALGMTRARARRAFRHVSTRHRPYMDFFCLIPTGIRAGYPSPWLLKTLSPAKRRRISGRVILILTAASYYSVRGVRPGATLASARRALRLTGPFAIGANDWYLAPLRGGRAILKVRHGVVEEIGIADASLTPLGRGRAQRKAVMRFLVSFRKSKPPGVK
jgi:hypothetical protein